MKSTRLSLLAVLFATSIYAAAIDGFIPGMTVEKRQIAGYLPCPPGGKVGDVCDANLGRGPELPGQCAKPTGVSVFQDYTVMLSRSLPWEVLIFCR